MFGAYDAWPKANGLVSQYRNLLHRYVHLTSAGKATTFWTGIGAVRKHAYDAVGGFDPKQHMMEGVEFDMRLARHGFAVLRLQLLPCCLKSYTIGAPLVGSSGSNLSRVLHEGQR